MELNKIKHLLDKYEAGETSLQEEGVLRTYFTQEVIHPELESYQILLHSLKKVKRSAAR